MTAGDTWVVPLDTAPVDASVLGGKGAALAELVAFGHPVPSGFVITVPAYLAMLALGGVSDAHAVLSAAFRSGQTRLDLAERIASAIDASPYPPGLAEQIAEQIVLLRLWDQSDGLIVRSSATVEDSKVFTDPWSLTVLLQRHTEPGFQLIENYCFTHEYDEFYPFPASDARSGAREAKP